MKSTLILGIFLMASSVYAGDKIGNGGGLWACVSPDQTVLKGALVDLYEAHEEFGLNIITSVDANPFNVSQERLNFLKSQWPEMYQAWSSDFSDVLGKIRLVDSELVVIDDALFRLKPLPATCSGTWQYTQFANFTYLGQVLVQRGLWNSSVISSVDKAALVWHEVIYKWLRSNFGDKDSVRARQIVGLVFSDLPTSIMKMRMQEILNSSPMPPADPIPENTWVCMIKNRLNFLSYAGYGINELDAKTQATTNCQQQPDGYHCDQSAIRCEEMKSSVPHYVCQATNQIDFSVYSGKGRSLLEAEFFALNACSKVVNPVHCVLRQCQ